MEKDAPMEPELAKLKMETITKWVKATQDLLYPNRNETVAPCPIFVVGGYNTDIHHISSLSQGVDAAGADLVYLAFDWDDEAKGPKEILTMAVRDGLHMMDRNLKPWVSSDGVVKLIGHGGKTAHTFDADGMDKIKIETREIADAGYRKAKKILRKSVATSRTPVVNAQMLRAA